MISQTQIIPIGTGSLVTSIQSVYNLISLLLEKMKVQKNNAFIYSKKNKL